MVVAARGNERRARTEPLLQLEAEHVAVEPKRALEVGHLQVDVTDADVRMNRHTVGLRSPVSGLRWHQPVPTEDRRL